MINEQTLKIYEEIKKEHSQAEENFINKIEHFQSVLEENKIKIKDLFLKAIQETPIDKLDIDIVTTKKQNNDYIYEILIQTEIGNIKYSYLDKENMHPLNKGLHCIFFSKFYCLENIMTQAEKDTVDKFIDIVRDYLTRKEEIQYWNNKSEKYMQQAIQIQGSNNANNN